jgi:hypothetical protein
MPQVPSRTEKVKHAAARPATPTPKPLEHFPSLLNRAGFPRRGGSDSSCVERSPLGGTGVQLGRGEPEAAGRRSALGEDRGACAADPGHCGEGPPAMRRRAPCVAAPPSPAPLSLPWNRRATARWCWIRPPIGCPSGSQAARPVGQPLATRRAAGLMEGVDASGVADNAGSMMSRSCARAVPTASASVLIRRAAARCRSRKIERGPWVVSGVIVAPIGRSVRSQDH